MDECLIPESHGLNQHWLVNCCGWWQDEIPRDGPKWSRTCSRGCVRNKDGEKVSALLNILHTWHKVKWKTYAVNWLEKLVGVLNTEFVAVLIISSLFFVMCSVRKKLAAARNGSIKMPPVNSDNVLKGAIEQCPIPVSELPPENARSKTDQYGRRGMGLSGFFYVYRVFVMFSDQFNQDLKDVFYKNRNHYFCKSLLL